MKTQAKCQIPESASMNYLETKILLQFYILEVAILKMSSMKWKILILN